MARVFPSGNSPGTDDQGNSNLYFFADDSIQLGETPARKLQLESTEVPATADGISRFHAAQISPAAGESQPKTVDFDDYLTLIGQFGLFQLIVFIITSMAVLAEAIIVLAYVFVVATPDHHCSVPQLGRFNLTLDERLKVSVPEDSEGEGYSSCKMYDYEYGNWSEEDVRRALEGGMNGSEVKCRHGWVYDESIFSSTLVTEFDLVCDDEWKASFAYTAVGLGQLVGACFWGFISDSYGRKKPYYIALTGMIVIGGCVAASQHYVTYCVLQFLMAVCTVACFATGVTIVIEMSGVKWRGHVAAAVNYFWTAGFMLLAGVAYAVRDWRALQLAVTAPFLLLLLGVFIVPESPRWLYCKKKSAEADVIMRTITHFNKVQHPPAAVQVTCPDEGEESVSSRVVIINLCRSNKIRLHNLILGFNWFSNALIYYGISLLLPSMSEEIYLSFFVSGAVEIPGYIIAQLTLTYAGRRWPLFGAMLIGGLALLVTIPVPEELSWLTLILALIGKCCVTASWAIAICFTAELYPTVIRGAGLYVCTFCGNLGNALAPQVRLLGAFGSYVPFLIFGLFSICAGTSSLLLPETKDTHLTDTIQQAELFARMNKTKKKMDKNIS